MLPPDDVLVAHLTLLGFVGWNDGSMGVWGWSLWYGNMLAWLPTDDAEPDILSWRHHEIQFPVVPLGEFPQPLLRKLAIALLERSDGS
ncbi:TPA: hypothetical protein QDE31_37535 [Burkholderia cenocepacia]|nr:hypothetical protein [Burkholderia cenocepacia]HDR9875409.1 hypothetical protein [Burkholderia cenocepacia]